MKIRNLALLAVALVMTGCATMNPFAGIANPPQQPKKLANYSQTEKQIPLKIGVTPDNKDVIAYATERTYTASSEETPEKLTFVQRLGRWIGSLTLIALIAIIACLAFGFVAPFMFLAKRYFTLKATLKKVVAGIDDLSKEDAAAYAKLTVGDGAEPGLSGAMNDPEKKLIKALRVEIK